MYLFFEMYNNNYITPYFLPQLLPATLLVSLKLIASFS